jgi:hypothetical protein
VQFEAVAVPGNENIDPAAAQSIRQILVGGDDPRSIANRRLEDRGVPATDGGKARESATQRGGRSSARYPSEHEPVEFPQDRGRNREGRAGSKSVDLGR